MQAEPQKLADGRVLELGRRVRHLPGKREVWHGWLDQQQVYVKIYLDPKRNKAHLQRELAGLAAFHKRGIASTTVCYSGELHCGHPVIVSEALPEPESLRTAWASGDLSQRERLLAEMMKLLARHHQAGLVQTDLHFGNFIMSRGVIYSLDGDGVRAIEGQLDQRRSLTNLALFFAQLPPKWDYLIPRLHGNYLEARGWGAASDPNALLQQTQVARKRRWSERQAKLFRECSAFVRRSSGDDFMIVDRQDYSPTLHDVLGDIDSTRPTDQIILKDGNTTTVWKTTIADLSLVVKRYNAKGIWFGLKSRFLTGRAIASWRNAHRLRFNGIATPRPIALIRVRRGRCRTVTYFIAEAVEKISIKKWFRDASIPIAEKEIMAGKIIDVFKQLSNQRVSHGDLKGGNIVIVGSEVYLIDLDSMRWHKSRFMFRLAWREDMKRFISNWDNAPELRRLFLGALKRAELI